MRGVLLLWAIAATLSAAAQRIPLVRVGLASFGAVAEFRVSSASAFGAYDSSTHEVISSWPAGAEAIVRATGSQVQIGGRLVTDAYFSSEGPRMSLAGGAVKREYRGWIHFSVVEGKLVAVNEASLEIYLMGVVPCEMPPSWHPEALKAQAVAARTYALTRIGAFRSEGYDIDDTTRSQTYRGIGVENPRTNEAIRATSNQILVFGGRPIQALYATVSGGFTASAAEAFGNAGAPYLVAFADVDENGRPYASGSRHFSWKATFSAADLSRRLEPKQVGPVTAVAVVERSDSGRVVSVKVSGGRGEAVIAASELRRLLGVDVLKSTLFDVRKSEGGWAFDGRGWGHGVGMCQTGADGRAKAGQTYEQILAAYYPGATLLTVRTSPLEMATRGSFLDRRKFSRQ